METGGQNERQNTIELVGELDLGEPDGKPAEQTLSQLYNGDGRRIVKVELGAGEMLAKHKASEPISVLCLAGRGVFLAGAALEDRQALSAGTLITLDADVPHEVTTVDGLRLLVTKFKKY